MALMKYRLNLIFLVISLYPTINIADSDSNHQQALFAHDDNPKLIAVIPESFPPFYHTDAEGLPYGMAIEVMNEIDHHAGYLTQYIIKKSWSEVFSSMAANEAQIIPNLGITEERKKHYLFTVPYVKTEVGIFTRNDNKIKKESSLKNSSIGVVKNNIGEKIAKKNNINEVTVFDSIHLAYIALETKQIDAIIYPRKIALKYAETFAISDNIYDTKITLATIQRAIAVNKKHPEVYQRLNNALKDYLTTQSYHDTYAAWLDTKHQSFNTTYLILIICLIFIASISVFIYIWKKRKFPVHKDNNSVVLILSLIIILITATTLVTSIALFILYETSFNEQRQRLVDSVKSRARLIESIARYDSNEPKVNQVEVTSYERTLSQLIDAHNRFRGFGKTGEFVVAKLDNEKIEFILKQRHAKFNINTSISMKEKVDRAIPMQLALLGHSGTIIGEDYRGKTVLSAYEPIKILNLGIVAKIDLSEIRQPFIDSGLFIIGFVILVSFFGALLFFNIMMPVIKKIKDTEQRFIQLFRNNQSISFLVNPKNARIIDANEAAIKFYGYSLTELSTYNLSILYPKSSKEMNQQLIQAITGEQTNFITRHRLQNGKTRDMEVITSPVEIDNTTIIYYVATDITDKILKEKEYQKLQQELEQIRKMDALGQLTGGIAHDFNNMLGIIMGYTDLAHNKLKESDSKISEYLKHVLTASERAQQLISSMMLFSRTESESNQVLDISSLIKEDLKMLRSIIPTSIDMISDIREDLPHVLIEPVKLQQLIMNLCVNARDAMNNQGKLTIKLDIKSDIHAHCRICYEDINDEWIELSVADTGTGMSDEVIEHLFEPFFTTKEKNKGTGMGMSVVHGIVKSLDSHILIDTETNKGTTISILFKPVNKSTDSITEQQQTLHPLKETKTVLVVDDEKDIANLLCEMLLANNCECDFFFSPLVALSEFEKQPDKYDIIISDQTMPDLTGFEMIKKIRLLRPDIPAIVATGYSDSIDQDIAKEHNITLLNKPVSNKTLLKTVNKFFE